MTVTASFVLEKDEKKDAIIIMRPKRRKTLPTLSSLANPVRVEADIMMS